MNKPEITATIKFRGVTIEGMTIAELKELRDLLNSLVGEKKVERVVEHHDYYPWPGRYWVTYGEGETFGPSLTTNNTGTPYASTDIVISCVN